MPIEFFYECTGASYLLSVAWWAVTYNGRAGYPEVCCIRLVCRGYTLVDVAHANKIHRPVSGCTVQTAPWAIRDGSHLTKNAIEDALALLCLRELPAACVGVNEAFLKSMKSAFPSHEPASYAAHELFKMLLAARETLLRAVDSVRAKSQLGHMCFDVAMFAAGTRLKGSWALCGGYALSCLRRLASYAHLGADAEIFVKYRYVDFLDEPCVRARYEFGDVDFFQLNPSGVEWTDTMSAAAVSEASKVLCECLTDVAAYSGLRIEDLASASVPDSVTARDVGDDLESQDSQEMPLESDTAHEMDALLKTYRQMPFGFRINGLRHLSVGRALLGREVNLQLVLSSKPCTSPVRVVMGFDMTQVAIWVEGLCLNRAGEACVVLGSPSATWLFGMLAGKGWVIVGPFTIDAARLAKYQARGYFVTTQVHNNGQLPLHKLMTDAPTPARAHLALVP